MKRRDRERLLEEIAWFEAHHRLPREKKASRMAWRKIYRVGGADGFTEDHLVERFDRPREIGLPEEFIEELVREFPPVRVSAGCIPGGKLRRDDLSVRLFLESIAGGPSRAQLAAKYGLKESAVSKHVYRGKRLLAELYG